jgi:hypothetical protein
MYLPSRVASGKIMVYFHGNAEDIGLASDILTHIRDKMKINVLAVEYPGYGIYKGQPSSSQIIKDALTVYDYLT